MSTIKLLNNFTHHRTSWEQARTSFIKCCRLRNLSEQTITFYEEDINYFFKTVKLRTNNVDEVSQTIYDDFFLEELGKGKRNTSLNSRARGLNVFFKFCAQNNMMDPINFKLMKEDADIKEPYSDKELFLLLERPKSNSWAEYRDWAVINYLLATGNRLRTVVNLKISDISFEEMTIRLETVKNRKKQIIPLSPALKNILLDYLGLWKWEKDDYLFPNYLGKRISERSLQQSIAKYNNSRGVAKTSIHLFRHTFAKNYIMNGGGMAQLQSLLGHSTLDMTRHYIALYGSDLQKDYERLNPLDNLLKQR